MRICGALMGGTAADAAGRKTIMELSRKAKTMIFFFIKNLPIPTIVRWAAKFRMMKNRKPKGRFTQLQARFPDDSRPTWVWVCHNLCGH